MKISVLETPTGPRPSFLHLRSVLTLAPRMFVINEKLFLFAIVDRYPFATCAKDIFV